jgi:hypothetical protein
MNLALANILGIAICGVLGGLSAWAVVAWAGLAGVVGALVALFTGMVIATAAFATGIAILRALGRMK